MADNLSFYEESAGGRSVSVVSVPMELGSDERGLAAAPKYLLDSGLPSVITSAGHDLSATYKIHCPSTAKVASAGVMKHAHEVAAVARRTATLVEKLARKGETVISLGGDHSAAIGSLAGAAAAHPSLGIIYIDAHPDCHTDASTITGNVHGMVTSALMGEGHTLLTSVAKRHVPAADLVYIGLKDFDSAEIEYLRSRRARCFTMLDIVRRGISPALAAIDALAKRTGKVWISMDMDSIDEVHSPGVGLATPDGLTRREALALAHYIGKTCDIAGFDIVEMVPAKDPDKRTAGLALELSARFLGGEHSWYQRAYIDTYRETNIAQDAETVPLRRR